MDTTASDYIRHRLLRYEASIDKTRARFQDPAATGSLTASAPFAEQCAIPALLDSLTGNPSEQAVLRQDYVRITKKLELLARESGPGFRASLFTELTDLAHAYHASACHASICTIPDEAATDPCRRRLISLLLAEMKRDHDVSGIEAFLSMIDDNHQRSVTVHDTGRTGLPAGDRARTRGAGPEHGSSGRDSGQVRIE
jgi:hypothetical protein